jgi:hypothetical protein
MTGPGNNLNIAEELVRAVSYHLQLRPEISLTARDEKTAAAAMYNLILTEANRRYESDVPTMPVEARKYRWFPEIGRNYKSLFCKDFNLIM